MHYLYFTTNLFLITTSYEDKELFNLHTGRSSANDRPRKKLSEHE